MFIHDIGTNCGHAPQPPVGHASMPTLRTSKPIHDKLSFGLVYWTLERLPSSRPKQGSVFYQKSLKANVETTLAIIRVLIISGPVPSAYE